MGCCPEKFRIVRLIVVLPRKIPYNHLVQANYMETVSRISSLVRLIRQW
jgi:hypothetical protein